MAKDYDNSNRGALWINDDRREGKEDPHFRGNVLLRISNDEILDNGDGTSTIHRFISGWDGRATATRLVTTSALQSARSARRPTANKP
jgi:hypothetical protein